MWMCFPSPFPFHHTSVKFDLSVGTVSVVFAHTGSQTNNSKHATNSHSDMRPESHVGSPAHHNSSGQVTPMIQPHVM